MQYFTMTYLPDGRISSKYITSTANIEGSTVTTTKTMTYSYNTKHSPYQVVTTDFSNNTITPVISTATYTWSANGNLTLDAHNHTNTTFSWDEENRLTNYVSSTTCGYYLYDTGGERYYKCSGMFYYFVWNGHGTSYYAYSSPVLYASQYLVVSANEYTKHYYAGNERIASRIGEGRFPALNSHCVANSLLAAKKPAANANLPSTHYASNSFTWFHTLTDNTAAKAPIYWTHGDHLGSTAWVTDTAGAGVQHFRYLPFGEPLYSKKTGTFSSRYTFSGKERDSESGLNYFGARYYNSDLSIWLSVDPLSDKYPNLSPYTYCAGNPVRLVDPDGEEVIVTGKEADAYVAQLSTKNLKISKYDDGKLYYSGTAKTSVEKQMKAAIDSKNIIVDICAETSSKVNEIDNAIFYGGAFLGTTYSIDDKGRENAVAYQQVNPMELSKMGHDTGAGVGMFARHELTEAFEAGILSIKHKFSSPRAGIPGSLYKQAHQNASFVYDLIRTDVMIKLPNISRFTQKWTTISMYFYSVDNSNIE